MYRVKTLLFLFAHVAAFDEATLDAGARIRQLFAAIILDALSPNASSSFRMKASDAGLASVRKVDPNSTILVQLVHGERGGIRRGSHSNRSCGTGIRSGGGGSRIAGDGRQRGRW